MDIYPEDLGPRHCRQVLEDRLLYGGNAGIDWVSGRTVSLSGRVQLQKRDTLWCVAIAFISAWMIGGLLGSFMGGAIVFAVTSFLGIIGTKSWYGPGGKGHIMPSGQQGLAEPSANTYARLTEPEVTSLQNALLRKGNDDPLLGMYLELVWGAMHLDPLATGQAETERSVREAIRALGGAIESLPPQTLDGVPDSDASLQAVAARLASEATGETDPVVAASLGRRVEALRGQAETVARVRVLLRRNLALREELADQIGALRTSLAAAALSGDDSGLELAGLAARIRRVASEANAVTAARVEVDALLSQPQVRVSAPAGAEEGRRQVLGLDGEAL